MSALRRFKPYPAYRDSGVEWLGEIPAHWEVNRTKFAARLYSGHTPSRQHPEYWQDCTIPWFGLADVWQIRDGQIEYVCETTEKISELGLANSAARLLPKGTVILSRTASVGFSAILGVDMATTQDFVNWVCGPTLRPEYLLYVFRSMGHEFRRLTMGSTHQTIYMPDVGAFSTPIPPPLEQDQIVAFIRAETARIDALVAKKERLIELLREKRTALITRAVTRGLDPSVPMKDSGVAWLGEIPAHWEVKRIKNISRFVTSGSRGWAEHYADEGAIFLRIGNLKTGSVELDLSDVQHVSPPPGTEGARTLVRAGDVLISITALIGAVGVVPAEMPAAFVNQHLALVRLSSRSVRPRWLAYCALSRVGHEQLQANLYGGTKDGLNLDDIRSLMVLVPPKEEQDRMIQTLDRTGADADALIAKVGDAIDRLQELRNALVSAAVTGKIDGRY